MLNPGSKIKNIEIESFIGEGGMGLVFKGKDIKQKRTVAVKALRSDFSRNDEMLHRFQGKIQAKLGKHKNIVPIYDFFEEDENHYLIMEYIEGETLQQIIDQVGLIPPDRGLAIFKGILSAVAHAHSKNIIHRDLKPSNVLINSKDEAKVMDFGIAKEEGTRGFTQTGGLVGSFHYMAPELFRGNNASKQSDVWSLGVTLFEILTGHLPFKGKRDDACRGTRNARNTYNVQRTHTQTRRTHRPNTGTYAAFSNRTWPTVRCAPRMLGDVPPPPGVIT